ncbi:Uma2 family endonuclease [Nocardia sp. NPDC051321]|uniref:Uma2 family endonuclease n=1 Tax=Nocardia sp. NPDC051321 TaxID=3364323 RepID=UPI0037B83EA4
MSSMDADVTLAEFEVLERASSEEVDVELINGRIYVVPVPDGEHDAYTMLIGDQVRDHCPELRLLPERGLRIPAYRESRARVDGAVAPREYFFDQPPWSDPSGVLMVLEVTSGRTRDAEVDRVEKRDAYAQASIPAYLLVDRHRAEVKIYWQPVGGEYQHVAAAKFGTLLRLPAPFDFDLDTTEFR